MDKLTDIVVANWNIMESVRKCLSTTNIKFRKYIICLLVTFLLLPLAMSPAKEYRCAYVIILVASYWIVEVMPIEATALLPIVLFPLLGVLDSKEVAESYMKESIMMLIGGLMLAIAIEECRLHERIALKVLLLVGTNIKWLMLGFMFMTMFMSMWINNGAAVAMMIPIVEVVAEQLALQQPQEPDIELDESNGNNSQISPKITEGHQKDTNQKRSSATKQTPVKITLLLSTCYAANIGGTGTLTGANPNIIFKSLLDELYPENEGVTYATWLMYNISSVFLCTFVGWVALYIMYGRNLRESCDLKCPENFKKFILNRYQSLGNFSFSEGVVSVLFVVVVLLWLFRDPKFVTGWQNIFPSNVKIGDSMPAILVSLLMFLIPANPRQFRTSPSLLQWQIVEKKLAWGMLIVVGGGIALAVGTQKSGLSVMVGRKMLSLSVFPPMAIVALSCILTAMITEIVTNSTTATILLPIFNQMAVGMKINPLYLMIPVTVTCCFAFMLPVATGPNTLVFISGQMKTSQMAKPGFIMNIICCGVQLFMINTLGVIMFDLNEYPTWANHLLPSLEISELPSKNITGNLHFMNFLNDSFL